MRLTGLTSFLRGSPCSRALPHLTSTPTHRRISLHQNQDLPDFGDYSIILPPEPLQFGTSHIRTLPVPPTIPLPFYALERQRRRDAGESDAEIDGAGNMDPYDEDADGRIELGGEEEGRVRAAAVLARNVRNFAGSLVKVRHLN